MPGVTVTTGAVAGPATAVRATSGTYFVAGLAERGPTDRAVLVNSMADFESKFGGRPSYGSLYDDIDTYFNEGGQRAYVVRVVGAAATTGALATPLADGAGTPQPTLQVTANGPGAWSSDLSVEVVAGTVANTFTLRIRYKGEVVQQWANLKSPQDAVNRTQTSPWVTITDLASATAPPGNNPAPVGPVALAAGTDDRAAVTASTMVTALALFERGLGDGAVAIPGIGDATHAGLIAHANANNRVALLSTAKGTTATNLIVLAAALDAHRAGLFAPWVRIPNGFGGTRAISPEGYIAGVRARAHEGTGPWQAAAGTLARARHVSAVDQVFSRTEAASLDDAKVNAIVSWIGGVRNYGWRSLSNDTENWSHLHHADTLNRIVVALEAVMEDRVFAAIDPKGQLLGAIAGDIEGVLRPIADRDGLFSWIDPITREVIDPGYSIVINESNNPRESLALNQVLADVKVRIAPTAASVLLTVTKAGVLASV